MDRYGRKIPKHSHGTENLKEYTSSSRILLDAATTLFERIVDPDLLVRRLYLTACRVLPETDAPQKDSYEQLDLFTDYNAEKSAVKQKRHGSPESGNVKKPYWKLNKNLERTLFSRE